jgi:CRISPR-associated protein Cas5d
VPALKNYPVCLEIAGPTAIWTRPDTGDAPVSYPAPTFSAARGIFDSVVWLRSAEVVPTKVEICAPLVYHNYTTNYGGPLRKNEQIRHGNNYQLIATVLINVCYRLYAEVRSCSAPGNRLSEQARRWATGINGAHAYQEMFQRRLSRGQFHRTPCLGWQEFLPDYLGPFRPETKVEEELTFVLPSMLHTVFPGPMISSRRPTFRQNVRIEKGVLHYAP